MTENLCIPSIIWLFNRLLALVEILFYFYLIKVFGILEKKMIQSILLKLDLLHNDPISSLNFITVTGQLGEVLTFTWVLI